jgi:hypothetical protein
MDVASHIVRMKKGLPLTDADPPGGFFRTVYHRGKEKSTGKPFFRAEKRPARGFLVSPLQVGAKCGMIYMEDY